MLSSVTKVTVKFIQVILNTRGLRRTTLIRGQRKHGDAASRVVFPSIHSLAFLIESQTEDPPLEARK